MRSRSCSDRTASSVHILARVDRRKCMANQQCIQLAPSLFELAPAGHSRTKRADETDFTAEDLPLLTEARDRCPTGAITVETMQDDEIAAD
jgi:ferredoxin